MGQFSWLDCITEKQILDDVIADVYVLVPNEFTDVYGKRIKETYYDGYGRFGGYDIYDLVALWNRDHISIENFIKPDKKSYGNDEAYRNALRYYQKKCDRLNDFISYRYSDSEMMQKYGDDYLRIIGIDIACYDEQNAALEYPIKITHNSSAIYEDVSSPSKSDPNQGWSFYRDDEEEDWI